MAAVTRMSGALNQTLVRICSFAVPLLLAAFPLLSLFAQNQSEVELSVLWVPLVLCVAAAAALYGLFWAITRQATKAGALASLVVVGVFFFGIFTENLSGLGLSDGWFFAIWLTLFVAAAVAVVRTRRTLVHLTVIAGVGAAVLALPTIVKIAVYHANHPAISLADPRLWPTQLAKPVAASGAPRPDIYVIVPDDYPRPDVLRKDFHYDDAVFLRQLESRGFTLSDQSRSPYSDSESNIAAALNMDYLSGLPKILGAKSEDVRPVKRLIQDNRASRLLATLGYRYVHIDTDEVTFAGSNPDISRFAPPDSLANLWMRKSVLRLIGGPLGFNTAATNARFRDSIGSQFAALEAVPKQPGPKFVVFHTLLPHDPYIYSAQGRPVTFPSSNEDDLGSRLGMRYFLPQLQYLNQRLLSAVDAIRAHSRTAPIIVIQADEGFQANPDTLGEEAALDIRVKGLEALSLPGMRGRRRPEPPNTVNTLRFVFNHSFGTQYPMLRSASYPEGDLPYQFEEMQVKK